MILHYFPEYLTPMLILGPRSYRSPNLVLVLQMWEDLESNLPVCQAHKAMCCFQTEVFGPINRPKILPKSIAQTHHQKIVQILELDTETEGRILFFGYQDKLSSKPRTTIQMEGTLDFTKDNWGRAFNPNNATQAHSIFVKL